MRPAYDLPHRTKSFAPAVIRLYSSLPKTTESGILGKQLLRAGTSVGANYREAHRGRSRAEFVAKLGDCLKELDESAYWLELLNDSGIARAADISPLSKECDELTAIFVTIVKKARNAEPSRE